MLDNLLDWMFRHVFATVSIAMAMLVLVVLGPLIIETLVPPNYYISERECVEYQISEKDMGQGLGPARYALYASETCFVQTSDEVWYQRSGGQWTRVGVVE